MRNLIIEAMARTLWADVWANVVEEDHQKENGFSEDVNLSGQELTEIAPPTPEEALLIARKLADMIDRESPDGMTLEGWAAHFELSAEEFGHNVAMGVVGHGVGIYVDHDAEEEGFPDFRVEVYAYRGDDGLIHVESSGIVEVLEGASGTTH
jgi:hypothetical protein